MNVPTTDPALAAPGSLPVVPHTLLARADKSGKHRLNANIRSLTDTVEKGLVIFGEQ